MLDKDNFVTYAMKAYDNPSCKTIGEFESDLDKFSNLIRLCNKEVDKDLTHLILNQVISLLNVFENESCIKMMFFRVRHENWDKLKTILVYLNRMPDEVQGTKSSEIELCNKIIVELRKI